MPTDKDIISSLRFKLEGLEQLRLRDNAYLLDKICTLQEALAPFAEVLPSASVVNSTDTCSDSRPILREEDFLRARKAMSCYPRLTRENVATQQLAVND